MLTDDDGDDYDCVLLWKMADLRKHYRSNYFHCLSPTKSLAVAVNSSEWEDVSRVNVDGPDLLMAAWVSRKCTLPSSLERIDILVGMDSFNRVLGTVTELEAPTVNGEPLPLLLPPELLACSCMAWFLEFFKRFPSSRFLPRADFEERWSTFAGKFPCRVRPDISSSSSAAPSAGLLSNALSLRVELVVSSNLFRQVKGNISKKRNRKVTLAKIPWTSVAPQDALHGILEMRWSQIDGFK
uniref:Uncharacterized protein n=1 Tax=Glossina pallidipes TaxID=7398 RepID=A0A1A9ZEM6_GLOPL